METLDLSNINILMNTATLVGIGYSLRKVSTAISGFTSRIENIEKEHEEVLKTIADMKIRHEINQNNINHIQITLGKFDEKFHNIDKKLDFIIEKGFK